MATLKAVRWPLEILEIIDADNPDIRARSDAPIPFSVIHFPMQFMGGVLPRGKEKGKRLLPRGKGFCATLHGKHTCQEC